MKGKEDILDYSKFSIQGKMLKNIKMREIITTFTSTVDLVNPILKHHHRRTAIIAYRIGRECNLSHKSLANLVVAASLHDIGALTVEDSIALTKLDVLDPLPHSLLGSGMLSSYKVFSTIKEIILHHHVNYEESLKKDEKIPYESFILHLADLIEILLNHNETALNQSEDIIEEIVVLSKTLFDPAIVESFVRVAKKEYFWFDVDNLSMDDLLSKVDIESICVKNDRESLEELVYTLSKIVDYKSKFTVSHSIGVAHVSYHLAKYCGFTDDKCREIKLAGYLHDIGKIAVPSEIISKPDKLTKHEFNIMKSHPYYTYQILKKINGLERIAEWASAHHERKDRSGYPRKPSIEKIVTEVEIIAYADVFTALCEERPYRKAFPIYKALKIIHENLKDKMGDQVYFVLEEHAEVLLKEIHEVQTKSIEEYYRYWREKSQNSLG